MTRNRNGDVVERQWQSGRGYALRFLANGRRQYVTLGLERDGWDRARAEEELLNVMADVRRGIWIRRRPARASGRANGATAAPATDPTQRLADDLDGRRSGFTSPVGLTFHAFATDWLARREGEVAPRTVEYEQWALTHHLLPHFAHTPLDAIDIAAVDAYRCTKVRESDRRRQAIEAGRPLRSGPNGAGPVLRPLSPATVNKTIDVLQAVLALAREYGHIADTPATGRRRRLKAPKPTPGTLDAAEPIQAVFDAAAELDADPRHRMRDRHAIIATLLFAGLRAHELCQLRWRDIDLPGARLHITRSKTDAGRRTIDLLSVLRAVLTARRNRSDTTGTDDLVFPTESGTQRDKDNLRNRVLQPTIPIADRLLAERGHPPLPRGLTPHKLRHTYASILVACGTDPATGSCTNSATPTPTSPSAPTPTPCDEAAQNGNGFRARVTVPVLLGKRAEALRRASAGAAGAAGAAGGTVIEPELARWPSHMGASQTDPMLSVEDVARSWSVSIETVATLVTDRYIESLDGGRLAREGRFDVPCIRRSWAERVRIDSAGAARRIDDPDSGNFHPAAAVAFDFHSALQEEDADSVYRLSSTESRNSTDTPRELLKTWLSTMGSAVGSGLSMTTGVYRLDPYPGVGVRLIYESFPIPMRVEKTTPVYPAGLIPLVFENAEWKADLPLAQLDVDWMNLISTPPPPESPRGPIHQDDPRPR